MLPVTAEHFHTTTSGKIQRGAFKAHFLNGRYDGALHSYLDDDLLLLSPHWNAARGLQCCETTELTTEELEAVQNFRCRDARTFKPGDRAIVLAAIRADWGSEEAFDEFVHTKLPKVYEGSKKRYSRQLWSAVEDSLQLVFSD